MRKLVYTFIVLLCALGCTKNNFIDSGLANGRHEGKSLLEYMETDSYNWDSTVLMVRHAGEDMVRLFEGKDEEHPEITFFGMTNHSIRRYLLDNDIERVEDLDAEWCRSILLKHIVDGKYYRKDIPKGIEGVWGTVGEGGISLKTLAGTDVWVYVFVEEQEGIVENVPHPVHIRFAESNNSFTVVSADIEPDNCLVHALSYEFTLGEEE